LAQRTQRSCINFLNNLFISAEPGIVYRFKKMNAYATVPVALVRNRTQSVADKLRTQITGVYAKGDAAFADYSINAGVAIIF
jgi:hypothetical protein